MNVPKTKWSPCHAVFLLLWPLMSNAASPYVEEACSVTRYRALCMRSLASFSHEAGRSPSKWARAGVSVTVDEVKVLLRYLKKYHRGREKSRVAVSDCVEVVQDALDNLHQSLHVLRRLNTGKFEGQMSDVLTWLSAALTDEDTCMDGLDEGRLQGRRVKEVNRRVANASYMTSNALALANRLATLGLESTVGGHEEP